jgi:hypothetical protein
MAACRFGAMLKKRAIFGEDIRDVESAFCIACAKRPHEAILRFAALVAHEAQSRFVGCDDGANARAMRE